MILATVSKVEDIINSLEKRGFCERAEAARDSPGRAWAARSLHAWLPARIAKPARERNAARVARERYGLHPCAAASRMQAIADAIFSRSRTARASAPAASRSAIH